MAKGILYFAQNPAFQHLTKIGKTTKDDIKDRKLSGSNVPEDFEYIALLDCDDVDWAEKKVHHQFEGYNHSTKTGRSTEFYWSGCIDDAIKYAKDLKGVSDQTDKNIKKIKKEEKEEEIEAGVLDTDSKEVRDEKLQRRQIFNFNDMGIPVGSVLIFIKDNKTSCKVISKDKVEYKGKTYSISALAKSLIGYHDTGMKYFTYNGKKLWDICKTL